MEEEIDALKEKLSDDEIATDYVKCAEITKQVEELSVTLSNYYTEWEELQEAAE